MVCLHCLLSYRFCINSALFRHLFMGKNFDAQGQVTPKSNLSEILCLSLVTRKIVKHPIKNEDAIASTTAFPCAQGQVTPKSMAGFGRISNSFEILCLSRLHACLMTIRSKVKALSCTQHFLHYKFTGNFFRRSRARNYEANVPIWPEIRTRPILYACPRYQQALSRFDQN